MVSRIVPVILLALLAALHAQLWLGRGSVPRVNAMQRQIDVQKAANEQARQVNARLTSEVRVVATGGLALVIAGRTKNIDRLDGLLTLKGLKIIYDKNQ